MHPEMTRALMTEIVRDRHARAADRRRSRRVLRLRRVAGRTIRPRVAWAS